MANPIPSTVFINPLESMCAFKVEARGAGTYKAKYAVKGDGILSTLFVKSIDPGATLEVNYYDTTLGEMDGERIELVSHTTITDSAVLPLSDQVCIPKFHWSPLVEAIVTGGNVEFGIYSSSKQISVLDKILAETGELPVTSEAGTPFHDNGSVTSEAEVEKKVLEFTVPGGTTRKLTQVIGTACGNEGIFQLKKGTEILASFVTTPANATIPFKFDPSLSIPTGSTVSLYFTANEDNDPVDVFGHIMATDI